MANKVEIATLAFVVFIVAVLIVIAVLVGVYAKRITVQVTTATGHVKRLTEPANVASVAAKTVSGAVQGVTKGVGGLVQQAKAAAANL